MAGTTPNRAYPYPSPTDADNVPADIQSLATALDTDVAAVKTTADSTKTLLATLLGGKRLAYGVYSISLSSAAVQQGSIQFGITFSSPPPVIVAQQATGGVSPLKIGFNIDPSNATTTNCRVGFWNSTGAAFNPYTIAWIAIGAA